MNRACRERRRAPRRIVRPRNDFRARPRGLRCRGAPPPARPDASCCSRLRLLEARATTTATAPGRAPVADLGGRRHGALRGRRLGGRHLREQGGGAALPERCLAPGPHGHRQDRVPRARQPGPAAAAGCGRAPRADEARRVGALGRRRRAAREGRRPAPTRGTIYGAPNADSRPASTSPSPTRAPRPRRPRSRASSSCASRRRRGTGSGSSSAARTSP